MRRACGNSVLHFLVFVSYNYIVSSTIPLHKVTAVEELEAGTVIADASEFLAQESRSNRGEFKLFSQGLERAIGQEVKLEESRGNGAWLEVDSGTGLIRLAKKIDRDDICQKARVCKITASVAFTVGELTSLADLELTIEDINDNPPIFPTTLHKINVSENWPLRDSINIDEFQATDRDSGTNGRLEYKISHNRNFRIRQYLDTRNFTCLRIFLQRPLDYEETENFELQINVSDKGLPARSDSMRLYIHVVDENDHYPIFKRQNPTAKLKESSLPGTIITRVEAIDADHGDYGRVHYFISPRNMGSISKIISVNTLDGRVTLRRQISWNKFPIIKVLITASDYDKSNPKTTDTLLTIITEDVNDNAPTISVYFITKHSRNTIYLRETTPVHSYVAKLSIQDADQGKNGEIVDIRIETNYRKAVSRSERNKGEIFGMTSGGYMETLRKLDRAVDDRYNVTVTACDGGFTQRCGKHSLNILVLDVNNFAPRIFAKSQRISLPENAAVGRIVANASAYDKDASQGKGWTIDENGTVVLSRNGDVTYELFSDKNDGTFTIQKRTGIVRLAKRLDRETKERWKIKVIATDEGFPKKSDVGYIDVTVLDCNDNPPVFQRPSVNGSLITASLSGPNPIAQIYAVDRDTGSNGEITYSFVGRKYPTFALNPKSGKLMINYTATNTTELLGRHDLTIQATDSGQPVRKSTLEIRLDVVEILQSNRRPGSIDSSTRFAKISKVFAISMGSVCGILLVVLALIVIITKRLSRQKAISSTTFDEIKSIRDSQVTAVNKVNSRYRVTECEVRDKLLDGDRAQRPFVVLPRRIDLTCSPYSDTDSGRGDSDVDGACSIAATQHLKGNLQRMTVAADTRRRPASYSQEPKLHETIQVCKPQRPSSLCAGTGYTLRPSYDRHVTHLLRASDTTNDSDKTTNENKITCNMDDVNHQYLTLSRQGLPGRRYVRSTSMEKALGIYSNVTANNISTGSPGSQSSATSSCNTSEHEEDKDYSSCEGFHLRI